MNTYTLIITWNVPFYGRREAVYTHFKSYAAAMKIVDGCKTSQSFISAFIKKN